MSAPLVLGLCLAPSAVLAVAVGVVVLYDLRRDRSARARSRQFGGVSRVRVQTGAEREEWVRLRSGAAWVEAYALQLDEIRALPEAEPWRRWVV